jgi:hypothetical protein
MIDVRLKQNEVFGCFPRLLKLVLHETPSLKAKAVVISRGGGASSLKRERESA